MVFEACKRDASWFIAAANGDMNAINAKMGKHLGTKDFRATNLDSGKGANSDIIKGFTALQYACYYGHIELVKILLPQEIQILTEKEVAIPSPGFSPSARYKLLSGSTCMSVALLRGKGEIVKYILTFVESNPDKRSTIIGKLDDDNLCTYLIGTICKFQESYDYLKHPIIVDTEFFLCKTGDMTPVMNSAFFGRPKVAQIICDLAEEAKYQEGIYKMVLQRDNGDATCLDLCKQEVDYGKYGTSVEEKQECYTLLRQLAHTAYKYAEEHKASGEWATVLAGFTKGNSFEQIFGAEPIMAAVKGDAKKKGVADSDDSDESDEDDEDDDDDEDDSDEDEDDEDDS